MVWMTELGVLGWHGAAGIVGGKGDEIARLDGGRGCGTAAAAVVVHGKTLVEGGMPTVVVRSLAVPAFPGAFAADRPE